jgi:hypothetical protein
MRCHAATIDTLAVTGVMFNMILNIGELIIDCQEKLLVKYMFTKQHPRPVKHEYKIKGNLARSRKDSLHSRVFVTIIKRIPGPSLRLGVFALDAFLFPACPG